MLTKIILILGFCLSAGLGAADEPVATLSALKPKISRQKLGADKAASLKLGASIYIGDRVSSSALGVAGFVMADGSILRLPPNSEIRFDGAPQGQSGSFVGLLKGFLQAAVKSQGQPHFFITTNNSVSAVKGTELQVEAKPEGSELKVLSGQVSLSNNLGGPATEVAAGQAAMVSGEQVSPPRVMSAAEMKKLRAAFADRVFRVKKSYSDRVKKLKGGN
jgi:hypothetical protein